ncbi:MAG TPA: acetate--CoA ligase family protein [Candidatus Nanoarchaeia archaeon]|nr:acetate--CoA ligase family protein [Candidatus Nanoarchaeia archaeon]
MPEYLAFDKCIKLLKKHKIALSPYFILSSKEQAISVAASVGYPLVIKAYADGIVHKFKEGYVKTGISSEDELSKEYTSISKKAKARKNCAIVIQKEAKGFEMILGAKLDPTFGYVVLLGLGGIYTEYLKKFSMRVLPITSKDAADMVEEMQIITGRIAKQKVANLILSISKMAVKEKMLELDLNPVIIGKDDINIADVRILTWP